MKKVIAIVGPTASGKTSFSISLAKAIGAEIVSGDSVQVYRGLDIGSGKIKEEEKEGIKHYLIDILSPKENYSVAMFQRMAREIIDGSDKPIIICGGTGLYLKACLYDYTFNLEEGPNTDPELEKMDNESLYELLKKIDPIQADKIHPNNRRRLMRSITIAQRSEKRQSEMIDEQEHGLIYDAAVVGCTMDREVLYERINQRVLKMMEEGLEEEVKGLIDQGVNFNDQSMQAIGYKEWRSFLEGAMSREEVVEEIQKHSRQFAKRQYTWFRNQMNVNWFNPSDIKETESMIKAIKEWRFEDGNIK